MVHIAVAYLLVGVHRALVDLGGAGVTVLSELSLFLGGGLDYGGQLGVLCLEVGVLHGLAVLEPCNLVLACGDFLFGLAYALLCNLEQQVLVLDLLLEGVVLTAVGDVVEMLSVLGELGCALCRVVLVGGNRRCELGYLSLVLLYLRIDFRNFLLKRLHFKRKLAPELHDLVDLGICLLEGIESSQLILNADRGLSEIFLD